MPADPKPPAGGASSVTAQPRPGRAREDELQALREQLAALRSSYARTRAAADGARQLLLSMQASKFWQLRNAWFDVKKRLGLHAAGAQAHVDIILDDHHFDHHEHHDQGSGTSENEYDRWLEANALRGCDRDLIRELVECLPRRPLISVLVPVYDPPEHYLRTTLDSVLAQLYPDWELCLADDCSTRPHVRAILEEYAAADPRVKVVFRPVNGHISAASNSALALAGGEFVALLDHDDVLTPDALFHVALLANRHPDADLIYSDEDKVDDEGRRSEPFFKSDWSPDSLLSRMYIAHLAIYRRSLMVECGGFRIGYEGAQDYDLALRASERTGRIHHVPRVLYHWRIHAQSTSSVTQSKSYAFEAGGRALADALERRAEPGRVVALPEPGFYVVRYQITRPGKVSIVVPTRDHGDDVERCLTSIIARSTYLDFEIVLLDNGSTDAASLRTLRRWESSDARVRVVRYDVPFNFAKIVNYATRHCDGTYLLYLNNDTEVISPDWLEAMVEQAQRPSIGAVGAKLLYPDGTVQHAGVVLGIGGVAGHSHKDSPGQAHGYFNALRTVTNYSAVTGACLMVRREAFAAVGGWDEDLAVAFNDIDFCLKLRERGLYNVYLPHVVLYHHESKSRGHEDTPQKQERFRREIELMQTRWHLPQRPDPHYNPNLTLTREDYSLRV